MTKKQKLRRNRYATDFDSSGDSFILADLDLMLDEAEPDPVPLNPFLNDDVINRLLITTNYKEDDELGFAVGDSDSAIIEDINLSDQLSDFDEFVESIAKKEQIQKTTTEGTRFTDFHDLADFEEIPTTEDAIDRLLVNTGFEANIKLERVDGMPNTLGFDDLSQADGISVPHKCIFEPVELTVHNQQIETEEISAMDIHLVIDPDEIPDEKESIDRFIVNSVFDENDEFKEEDRMQGPLVTDNANLADDFPNFDHFVIESIREVVQNQQVEIAQFSVLEPQFMTGSDNISTEGKAIDSLFVDAGFEASKDLNEDVGTRNTRLIDDISPDNKPGVNFVKQDAMTTDAGIFDSERNKLMLDKDKADVFLAKEDISESTNQQQAISEKDYPKEDLELINNKAGIVKMKSVRSEVEYIKKQIQNTENKVKKVSTITYISFAIGIAAFLTSVAMGILLSSMQTKVSKLTALVSILEEDMSSITEKNSDLEINNSNSSFKRLKQKANGFSKQSENQALTSSDISEMEITTDLTKQSTVNKPVDNLQAKSSVSGKEKPLATVKKISPETKENKTKKAADWSVNLTAYEELSYAKSKAAKYLQRGIPVKVIAVDMNNTTWYRLKVGSFKNKEEATSYAAKIKKSLNLTSISVVNN